MLFCGDLTILLLGLAFHCFVIENRKSLCHSLGRPSRSDFVQFKFIAKSSPFDYLDLYDKKFYTLNFRVVRFAISEDSYESIITNLPKEDFPVEEIKKVYAMRWGIETSFRELKYAIGLCCFHSKKVEYIINLGR